jgi:tRNA U34 5-methylaminomethyl-2-thiouridine-forming methyltransferase MnmC
MQVLNTQDGSSTIFSPTFNVTYHSKFGAIQESKHVFIQNGLLPIILSPNKSIKILEVGFGTGLNFLLSHLSTYPKALTLNYTAIDTVPLDKELVNQINYVQQLNLDIHYHEFFHDMHDLSWGERHQIDPFTRLHKLPTDLIQYQPPLSSFNLVYFDAFAPTAQPELWESEILEKIYNALTPKGIFVTYCAKGSVKRIFKKLGGQVESLTGPPGKREMVRVIKPS